MAKIEQHTEKLTKKEMKMDIGENAFGYVYPQGNIEEIQAIEELLKKAGGKPQNCEINDYSQGGGGKAKPEFIITFNKKADTIIVVECKRNVKDHRSEKLNLPKDYAVDGVLYYAKFLKEKYNVIAVAISGTSKNNFKANTFYWQQNNEIYQEYKKATDIILEPENYLKLVNGEKIQKDFSLQEIRETAILMHDTLRTIKLTEKHKPIFIAGILIGLSSPTFAIEYEGCITFKSLANRLIEAIKEKLEESDIKKEKIENILYAFEIIKESPKLSIIPLQVDNSLLWYIKELEMKIKPMMDYSNSSLDALSIFYHEFVRYSGGDGNGLGIVLTPQHLADFMCEIAGVNKNSRVVDICCGSGSFLVSAMSKMFKEANFNEFDRIKKEQLYGVELDNDLFTLSIANMIVRGDGKSNLEHGDCFDNKIFNKLKDKNLNIGLINPPYSQKDQVELEFAERLLELLVVGGKACIVVPMSCAIGTKFKEVRERLFKKHTLLAVFSMPNDIFYPTGTNVCVMLWEAHKTHNPEISTFFGYYKNDGYVKAKKLGRIDKFDKWEDIKKKWVKLYRENEVEKGLTIKKCVNWNDEWTVEAYMETDYSNLKQEDFERTVGNYLASMVKNGVDAEVENE